MRKNLFFRAFRLGLLATLTGCVGGRGEIIGSALEKCRDTTPDNIRERDVVKRFLTYVSFDTHSRGHSSDFPSTEKQKDLGRYLADELADLGLKDAQMDDYGYVYATLPASAGSEDKPALALIAHMDVSPECPSADIHTVITLENGKHVIRTDGKTLLGADDKAGVAEIVTAAEQMLAHPEYPHPEIRLVFTPDEEVGGGTAHIDLDKVNAAYAYTLDGERVGDLCYETWNAAEATARFVGFSTHPGAGYKTMKSAIAMANDFMNLIPADRVPEETKDREGFFHLVNLRGKVASARLTCILRDFDQDGLQQKKDWMLAVGERINAKYGKGSCTVTIRDEYPNMRQYLLPKYEFLMQNVRDTYRELGMETRETPIRGGTDGSRLSQMGLPTPNLGTGGCEYHSLTEHVAAEDLEKTVEVLIRLSAKFA